MNLTLYPQEFTVCKLPGPEGLDLAAAYTFLAVTPEETSLVCPAARAPQNATHREEGWRMLGIEGTLDFSLVGILAGISSALAAAGVSLFALSTFNTDYILVKETQLAAATKALEGAGYAVVAAL